MSAWCHERTFRTTTLKEVAGLLLARRIRVLALADRQNISISTQLFHRSLTI